MEKLLTVTELAEEFNVTARTIRFYETKELISPQRVGSTRVYTYRDRARLKLILRAKRLGFSLTDIKEYLELYNADPEKIEQQQMMITKVGHRIHELEQQQEDLATTLDELRELQQQTQNNLDERGIELSQPKK